MVNETLRKLGIISSERVSEASSDLEDKYRPISVFHTHGLEENSPSYVLPPCSVIHHTQSSLLVKERAQKYEGRRVEPLSHSPGRVS
jgi:hypothetical protein